MRAPAGPRQPEVVIAQPPHVMVDREPGHVLPCGGGEPGGACGIAQHRDERVGDIRPARRFTMVLEDPVLGRSLAHAYEARALPIVA